MALSGQCAQRLLSVHSNQSNVCLQNEVAVLLKPISEKIQEIQTFRERNRGSNMFNHLSAVSESIAALGWIAVVSCNGMPHTPRHIFRDFQGHLHTPPFIVWSTEGRLLSGWLLQLSLTLCKPCAFYSEMGKCSFSLYKTPTACDSHPSHRSLLFFSFFEVFSFLS